MDTLRPITEIQHLATVEQGKQIELNCIDEGNSYSLMRIFADDSDESIWCEIEANGKVFQIPISVVEEAIRASREEVHSESWYERNVYLDDDS